jgi:hypothetical protein
MGRGADDAIPLDDVFVFNRSHLKLFQSNPRYRDFFTYVNSFSPEWIPAAEMAESFSLSLEETRKMLDDLVDLGVLLSEDDTYRASKSNYHFPDDEVFFDLRNRNLKENVHALLDKIQPDDLRTRRAFRGLVTRELTEGQLASLVVKLEELVGGAIAFPESENPKKVYSLALLLGERFERLSR